MSERDEAAVTTCDRCGFGLPFVHDLTEVERTLAEHFLSEIYAGHGDARRSSSPPDSPAEILRYDPHYTLSQTAILYARRLLLAFPNLALTAAADTGASDESAAGASGAGL